MSHKRESRKIQLTGGSTYIVSLPKWWVDRAGLKKGDGVELVLQPDGDLVVSLKQAIKRGPKASFIDATSWENPDDLVRRFLADYLSGYDVMEIRFGDASAVGTEARSYLKDAMRRKLVGVEVVEESEERLLVHCLLGYAELPLKSVLDRMHRISSLMHKDSVKALLEGDLRLAEDVAQRDDDVDRLYFFAVRQLKIAISNALVAKEIGLSSLRETLGYRLVAKSLERIADHAVGVAHAVKLTGRAPADISDQMFETSSMALSVVDDAMRALGAMDVKLAFRSISSAQEVVKYEERLAEVMFGLQVDAKQAAGLRLALEGIRRTAEYGADIAEVAVNMASDMAWEGREPQAGPS